jgi:hypothetical protein
MACLDVLWHARLAMLLLLLLLRPPVWLLRWVL